MTQPTPGETYTFTAETPLGNGPSAIPPGAVVTVRELVDADTPGAHDDSEDAVVVVYDEPHVGFGEDGNPVIVYFPRAYSVGVDTFASDYTKEG